LNSEIRIAGNWQDTKHFQNVQFT